jgi:hypothetical protein
MLGIESIKLLVGSGPLQSMYVPGFTELHCNGHFPQALTQDGQYYPHQGIGADITTVHLYVVVYYLIEALSLLIYHQIRYAL